jgi:hypothetical protein
LFTLCGETKPCVRCSWFDLSWSKCMSVYYWRINIGWMSRQWKYRQYELLFLFFLLFVLFIESLTAKGLFTFTCIQLSCSCEAFLCPCCHWLVRSDMTGTRLLPCTFLLRLLSLFYTKLRPLYIIKPRVVIFCPWITVTSELCDLCSW